MKGIAIIVPGADFSGSNLGRVTLLEDIGLQGLSVTGASEVTGRVVRLGVSYVPALTSDRDVVWSVVSGSQYATIDSSTGELTILSGADGSAVTVRVESANDSSIYAEKQLTLTYQESLLELVITGDSAVSGKTASFSLSYMYDGVETSAQEHKGCTWQIVSGPASIKTQDDDGCVVELDSTADGSAVVLRASSTVEQGVQATKTFTATYVGNNIRWTEGQKYIQGDDTWKVTSSGGHYVEREVTPGGTYTLCYDDEPFPAQIVFTNSEGTPVYYYNYYMTGFTVPSGATKVVINISNDRYRKDIATLLDWSKFTLEEGVLYSYEEKGCLVDAMLKGYGKMNTLGVIDGNANFSCLFVTLRRGKTLTLSGSWQVAVRTGTAIEFSKAGNWETSYTITASADGTQVIIGKQTSDAATMEGYLVGVTLS